jgi:hypothetical protein
MQTRVVRSKGVIEGGSGEDEDRVMSEDRGMGEGDDRGRDGRMGWRDGRGPVPGAAWVKGGEREPDPISDD